MLVLSKFQKLIKQPVLFIKWVLLSVFIGLVGGLIGTAFSYTLSFVTGLREGASWLIFLLPIGGLATVLIYYLFGLKENQGTNDIIDSVTSDKKVSFLIAPAIYLSTAITHLLGGSAGREGAALQMGGSAASALGRALRLKKEEQTVLIMSGMSAVFAALFGTPITACLFVMEFEAVGTVFSPALMPCFLSAFAASKVAAFCGLHPEIAIQKYSVDFKLSNSWRFILLSVLVALLGIAVCYVFHSAEHLAKKYLKNPWIRITVGGAIITSLTLLVGSRQFNGAGMEMALDAINGNAEWYFFVLKIVFTAITLAAGFKGGEIVPIFCIGATFGAVMGSVLGLDMSVSAALGLVGLFCSVTNSPIASIVLSIEMFGSKNFSLFVLMCVITFVLSGKGGLYEKQILRFKKLPATTDAE